MIAKQPLCGTLTKARVIVMTNSKRRNITGLWSSLSGRNAHLHHQLMSPWYEGQTVVMIKRFRYVLSERVAGAARRDAPAAPVVGVRPQKVAHGSLATTAAKGWGRFLNKNIKNHVHSSRLPQAEITTLITNQHRRRYDDFYLLALLFYEQASVCITTQEKTYCILFQGP